MEAIHEMTRLALETECEALRAEIKEHTSAYAELVISSVELRAKDKKRYKLVKKEVYLQGFEDGATEFATVISEILPLDAPDITPWNKKDMLLALKAWEKRYGDSKTNL